MASGELAISNYNDSRAYRLGGFYESYCMIDVAVEMAPIHFNFVLGEKNGWAVQPTILKRSAFDDAMLICDIRKPKVLTLNKRGCELSTRKYGGLA